MARSKNTCKFEGCGNPVAAWNMCNTHYKQWRNGVELHPIYSNVVHADATLAERIERHSEPGPNGCINWTGALAHRGHGQMGMRGRRGYVHRFVWEAAHGTIPAGIVIDHMCRNPRCVNIEHLQAVTPKQNNENRSGPSRISTSGVRGVSWDKATKSWKARAGSVWVGRFANLSDAEAAVSAARREVFTNSLADME